MVTTPAPARGCTALDAGGSLDDMSRYGYRPGGAPEISPEQRERNEAVLAALDEQARLNAEAVNAGLAGDMDEYLRLSAAAASVVIPSY